MRRRAAARRLSGGRGAQPPRRRRRRPPRTPQRRDVDVGLADAAQRRMSSSASSSITSTTSSTVMTPSSRPAGIDHRRRDQAVLPEQKAPPPPGPCLGREAAQLLLLELGQGRPRACCAARGSSGTAPTTGEARVDEEDVVEIVGQVGLGCADSRWPGRPSSMPGTATTSRCIRRPALYSGKARPCSMAARSAAAASRRIAPARPASRSLRIVDRVVGLELGQRRAGAFGPSASSTSSRTSSSR